MTHQTTASRSAFTVIHNVEKSKMKVFISMNFLFPIYFFKETEELLIDCEQGLKSMVFFAKSKRNLEFA